MCFVLCLSRIFTNPLITLLICPSKIQQLKNVYTEFFSSLLHIKSQDLCMYELRSYISRNLSKSSDFFEAGLRSISGQLLELLGAAYSWTGKANSQFDQESLESTGRHSGLYMS